MKRFLLVFFIAISLSWTAYVRTDGFSPKAIECPLFGHAKPPGPEVKAILSQPFQYLDKGRQCFVFISQDGQYVLKFFNQKYLQMPWYAWITGKREITKRQKRQFFYEHSYEIAFREFGEEILVLHMGKSQEMPSVCIRDKAHRKHVLDLNRIPFVLQRKGEPFYEGLEALFHKEGMKGLCRGIDQYLEQIENRISKKIADADIDIENNWGYIDGRLFHLDPGRLYFEMGLENPERRSKEWHNATYRLKKWLKVKYPEAATYLVSRLQEN